MPSALKIMYLIYAKKLLTKYLLSTILSQNSEDAVFLQRLSLFLFELFLFQIIIFLDPE
jgi:hypothetical protein